MFEANCPSGYNENGLMVIAHQLARVPKVLLARGLWMKNAKCWDLTQENQSSWAQSLQNKASFHQNQLFVSASSKNKALQLQIIVHPKNLGTLVRALKITPM